ncbi:MAG: hypothetical protein CBD97_00250 [Pelagibacteraceae bacterium TMED237]|nr:MAG: hypothetical protein CBD97_00250 [Pelagibacteraceae bacterium TMED237]|tara:strand:- start:17923 stop:18462 length:540 start_codon:yes stop_codon:yes gene_type:complete
MPRLDPNQLQDFNAPIPGEMLTAELGERPWQRPSKYSDITDVLNHYTENLLNTKVITKILTVIEQGVDLATIAETMMLSSVMEGTHSIDTGVLAIPYIVELLEYLCEEAGIEYNVGDEDEEDDSFINSLAAQDAMAEYKERLAIPEEVNLRGMSGRTEQEQQPEEPEQQGRGLMSRGEM